MEPAFGHDFSQVRLHTDARAAKSADAVNAHAYTFGNHIAFGRGELEPKLLAHELTHVVQQARGALSLQRKPKGPDKDPLCDTFDLDAAKTAVAAAAAAYKADPKVPQRQALVRALKPIRRCATAEEQAAAHAGIDDAIWAEAGTPFGGYTGMYPGYATDIKGELGKLGAKETVSYSKYPHAFKEGSLTPAQRKAAHRSRSKATAAAEVPDLARTDIIYFRGHQYAQYLAPGVFGDFNETEGFDLRYIEQAGGFANVKLMISTSCATLCKESFELFHGLFPNALILGYRKGAPAKGDLVRSTFAAQLRSLGRGLLLDQAVDVSAIAAAWKATVSSIHAGDKSRSVGYYGGTLNYWDGKAWQTIDSASDANKCEVHKDAREFFPAPK